MMHDIRHHDLDNGMDIYILEANGINISGIGVKAGAMHDPPGMSGMAHLVEHVLLSATQKYNYPETFDVLDRLFGGHDGCIDVATDKNNTYYGHTDPGSRKVM